MSVILIDRVFDVSEHHRWCPTHRRVCLSPDGKHREGVHTDIRILLRKPTVNHEGHRKSLTYAWGWCEEICFPQLRDRMLLSKSTHVRNAVQQWLRSHPEAAA